MNDRASYKYLISNPDMDISSIKVIVPRLKTENIIVWKRGQAFTIALLNKVEKINNAIVKA